MPPKADPPGGDTPPEPTPEPAEGGGDTPPSPDAETEKWKALARKHEAQAKANADAAKKLAELEEQDKTELQKLTDAKTLAEREAADARSMALRLEVAMDKAPDGMSVAQVRKLAKRLQGDTQEELEADADELFEEFTGGATPPPGRKPAENLKGGRDPEADPPVDADKIAERILNKHSY
jgi:hypothetical protein